MNHFQLTVSLLVEGGRTGEGRTCTWEWSSPAPASCRFPASCSTLEAPGCNHCGVRATNNSTLNIHTMDEHSNYSHPTITSDHTTLHFTQSWPCPHHTTACSTAANLGRHSRPCCRRVVSSCISSRGRPLSSSSGQLSKARLGPRVGWNDSISGVWNSAL